MSVPVSTNSASSRGGEAMGLVATSVVVRLRGVRVVNVTPARVALTTALVHVLNFGLVAQW